jgi:hypothetical protein
MLSPAEGAGVADGFGEAVGAGDLDGTGTVFWLACRNFHRQSRGGRRLTVFRDPIREGISCVNSKLILGRPKARVAVKVET